jgi:MipA family protein
LALSSRYDSSSGAGFNLGFSLSAHRFIAGLIGVLAAAAPLIANAQVPAGMGVDPLNVERPNNDGWDVTLGAGVGVAPNYQGSDSYRIAPLPLLNATWRNRVSIGIGGLNAFVYSSESARVGVGLTYDRGRKEDGGDPWAGSGDTERLRGMGDIDPAPGARIFGVYRLAPLFLSGTLTKYFGDSDNPATPQNDGALAALALGVPFYRAEKFRVNGNLTATLADEHYMQAYFGVTPAQSARSGYRTYAPKAGLRDVSASVTARYQFNRNWFGSGTVGVRQLTGDAADSPLVANDASVFLLTLIGFRF